MTKLNITKLWHFRLFIWSHPLPNGVVDLNPFLARGLDVAVMYRSNPIFKHRPWEGIKLFEVGSNWD